MTASSRLTQPAKVAGALRRAVPLMDSCVNSRWTTHGMYLRFTLMQYRAKLRQRIVASFHKTLPGCRRPRSLGVA